MRNTVSVFIADDHPLVRAGLRKAIEEEEGFVVVGEAGDGKTAHKFIVEHQPRISILDFEMPEMTGLDVAREVMRAKIHTTIIILTMYSDREIFEESIDIGILGYILKDSATMEVVRGIRAVLRGDYFVSPTLSGFALRNEEEDAHSPEIRLGLFHLTPSERRILKLVSENKTSAEIAVELAISPRTVENHRVNICRKLNLTGNNALLRFALTHRAQL